MNLEPHSQDYHKLQLITLAGNPFSILGLGNNPQMESNCIRVAYEAGINYFFFYNLTYQCLLQELRQLLAHQREQIVVATGSSDRSIEGLRQYREQVRQQLSTELVDVFFAEYVSPSDDIKQIQKVLAELHQWKEAGVIRYVGATTHNRTLAVELIQTGLCDVLMHRYNMAHRKAEEEVFPTALGRKIPVIAFTCTRWASLLKSHPHWTGEVPTAAECYRFALHHPAVRLALTAPQTTVELQQNLNVLQAPPLTPAEVVYWGEYGDLIYGNGQDDFETQWL